jgi:hypothetical protein
MSIMKKVASILAENPFVDVFRHNPNWRNLVIEEPSMDLKIDWVKSVDN